VNVDHAYAETLAITAREARNFAWGIRVLPGPKRRAVAALYAFARRVDDAADELGVDAGTRRGRLEEIGASLDGRPDDDAVLVALADARGRYPIPDAALHDLVRGGLMDTERTRYGSWEELREYCRCVAGAVGVACAGVYGPQEPARARPLAETLGLALQQINIMRDVPEDRQLGRIYLPEDERARFGVSEDEIAAGRPGAGWVPLMEHQAARAEALLDDGLGLLHLLDSRSRLCVRSFAGIYRGLLVQMRARDYDVFPRRPALSAIGKLRAVASLPVPPEGKR
jgi:15-cis-phytoene synthase